MVDGVLRCWHGHKKSVSLFRPAQHHVRYQMLDSKKSVRSANHSVVIGVALIKQCSKFFYSQCESIKKVTQETAAIIPQKTTQARVKGVNPTARLSPSSPTKIKVQIKGQTTIIPLS